MSRAKAHGLSEQIYGKVYNEWVSDATLELYDDVITNCEEGNQRAMEMQLEYMQQVEITPKPGLTRWQMELTIAAALNDFMEL